MIATPPPAEPQFVTVSAIVFPPEDGKSRFVSATFVLNSH